jgi:hypothetical protein
MQNPRLLPNPALRFKNVDELSAATVVTTGAATTLASALAKHLLRLPSSASKMFCGTTSGLPVWRDSLMLLHFETRVGSNNLHFFAIFPFASSRLPPQLSQVKFASRNEAGH